MALTQVQSGILADSTQTYGMKNRIINGAMVIDQRHAGAVHTPTSTLYCVDRWHVAMSQNSKFTAQQNAGAVTPPVGFVNYQGITSSSAYAVGDSDYFVLRQAIEGNNVSDLAFGTANAKTITVSFWVRSSLTGAFGGALYNYNGSRSYLFSYTINSANTWEYKTITIPGDTTGTWAATTGAGLYVSFSFGAGSTYNSPANAWAGGFYTQPSGSTSVVGTSGATWYVTGVQLEKGSTATQFDYRPYGTELILAQRYYEETNNNRSVEFQIHALTNGLMSTRFLVRKRASPTVTVFSSNTGVAGTVNNGNGNVQTGINGYAVYPDCFAVQMAGTASQVYTYFFTASAEL